MSTLSLYRINVFLKDTYEESFQVGHQLGEKMGLPRCMVKTARSYLIRGNYELATIEKVAREILCDPVLENYSINQLPEFNQGFDFQVEVGYRAGVVDNEARTLLSGLKDLLADKTTDKESLYDEQTVVLTSVIYIFKVASSESRLSVEKLTALAKQNLYNELIERCTVLSAEEFVKVQRTYKDTTASDYLSWQKNLEPLFAQPSFSQKLYEEIPLLELMKDSEKALAFSKEKLLFFNLEELTAIAEHYTKNEVQEERKKLGLPTNPTDIELEVLAQTWSEHCKHKIFAANIEYSANETGEPTKKILEIKSLYKTYIQSTTKILTPQRPDLISVFSDNSGIFSFTDDLAICMKVETHNSPSALDPFGGAITGILGVNRDILGTGIGAKPLFNTDVFCFADPHYSKPIPDKLLHPKRIFKGVHHGVERGGNESGIPTVNGAMVFDDRFLGKPLVFCGTGGILPKKITYNGKTVKTEEKEIFDGDLIVVVGGRVGKDGVHGATFSSEVLEATSPTSVVQIGDPIMQKKVTDFLLAARDQLLYRTLTDNGAGGLSSSIGEMATLVLEQGSESSEKPSRGNSLGKGGCVIHLDRHLTKYPGLQPWEILISESQERMTLAVQPENRAALVSLAALYDVEINFLGEFNNSGRLTAYYKNNLVANLDLEFLHEGIPTLKLKATWVPPQHTEPSHVEIDQAIKKFNENLGGNLNQILETLLAKPNIASKEYWVRQYDHEVKGLTVLKPFDGEEHDAPMDAAVLKPLFNSEKGLVISNGILPRYSDIDAYDMASGSIDEAVRNLVAVGGDPEKMTGLDNFCWPDPIASEENIDGEYKLAQLVRANQAMHEICLAYQLPLISGKDSMKNDYGRGKDKISVPPTLLFTALTTMEDVRKTCTSHFKTIGSSIYLLGDTYNELGGSEFFDILGWLGNHIPKVDAEKNFKLYKKIHQAINQELILSCHDLSDGGLGVALAESCFGSLVGAEIDLANIPLKGKVENKTENKDEPETKTPLPAWVKLFSESHGRFIVEIDSAVEKAWQELFKGLPIYRLGSTHAHERVLVKNNEEVVVDSEIETLKTIWKNSLIF